MGTIFIITVMANSLAKNPTKGGSPPKDITLKINKILLAGLIFNANISPVFEILYLLKASTIGSEIIE